MHVGVPHSPALYQLLGPVDQCDIRLLHQRPNLLGVVHLSDLLVAIPNAAPGELGIDLDAGRIHDVDNVGTELTQQQARKASGHTETKVTDTGAQLDHRQPAARSLRRI